MMSFGYITVHATGIAARQHAVLRGLRGKIMRFVPRYCLRERVALAKPVLSDRAGLMFRAGEYIGADDAETLERFGIVGVYAEDNVSKNLEIISPLSAELRRQTINGLVEMYAPDNENENKKAAEMRRVKKLAREITDGLLLQKRTMLNLYNLETYDIHTAFHSLNVAVISLAIGMGAGFGRKLLHQLAFAALMHDIGKVFINPDVTRKRAPLSTEEFRRIKEHPSEGSEYLERAFKLKAHDPVVLGVMDHHERMDGKGYPNQKRGAEISDFGKIIAIADVYDALISDRPYKNSFFPPDAAKVIKDSAGGQFDRAMAQVFLRKVALFPVGSCVQLSNGARGIVTENFAGMTHRPSLRIIAHGERQIEPYPLNLSEEHEEIAVVASLGAAYAETLK